MLSAQWIDSAKLIQLRSHNEPSSEQKNHRPAGHLRRRETHRLFSKKILYGKYMNIYGKIIEKVRNMKMFQWCLSARNRSPDPRSPERLILMASESKWRSFKRDDPNGEHCRKMRIGDLLIVSFQYVLFPCFFLPILVPYVAITMVFPCFFCAC